MNIQQFTNPQFWTSLFPNWWSIIINIIDIALVAWLLYFFDQGHRWDQDHDFGSWSYYLFLMQFLANFLGLTTISWLINQVITYGVIALVVIFSPEIRIGLERLGRATEFFTTSEVSQEEKMVQAYVKAVAYMSPRKIGALVAIQGARTLQEYISTGIPLDAEISGELLINIFIPNTPLHDGAVIVRNDKIAVSCAYLPLTENTGISKEFGTRHRAAIGLSEVSDAFTFVVSEETGGVSVTYNGTFRHDLTLEEFESELRAFLVPEENKTISWKERLFGRVTK